MEISIKLEKKHLDELSQSQFDLVKSAQNAARNAHAPYSNFQVGAAVLFRSGNVVLGNNQENAAYPSGLCAERVALFAARANESTEPISSLAIFSPSFKNMDSYPMPCGACRQVMWEYQSMQKASITILICNKNNEILVVTDVAQLLPFQFNLDG